MKRPIYFHFRLYADGDVKAKGGVTVRVQRSSGVLLLTHAVCSWRDPYCKRTGRRIAKGRVHSTEWKHRRSVFVSIDKSFETVVKEATILADDVARNLLEVTGHTLLLPYKSRSQRTIKSAHGTPSIPIEKIREAVRRDLPDDEYEALQAECTNPLCHNGTVPVGEEGQRTWCIDCALRTDAAREAKA